MTFYHTTPHNHTSTLNMKKLLVISNVYRFLQNLKSMENAIEKMVASSDSPSEATLSKIINKFAEEVSVKPDSAYARYQILHDYTYIFNLFT